MTNNNDKTYLKMNIPKNWKNKHCVLLHYTLNSWSRCIINYTWQLVNNLIKPNNKSLLQHKRKQHSKSENESRYSWHLASSYYLLGIVLFRSSVTRGHSLLVLELGSHISHFLHAFDLRILPTVQFQVFHFAYVHAHPPVHPSASGAYENADIVGRPFWICTNEI